MIGGTRPAKHLSREREYHRHFGGISVDQIPDFNVDSGLTMPNQIADNAPTECVGYTGADFLTDIFKVPFSPDFTYAAARQISGDGPGIDGASFHAGLQSLVMFGGLKQTDATIAAIDKGEMFISDWNNWGLETRLKKSYAYKQNGVLNVLGFGDPFTSILSACYTNKLAVSLGTPWYLEWSHPSDAGVVPAPINPRNVQLLGWHNYAAKGKKTIKGIPHLAVKSWQGNNVGDGGWLYFPREVVNTALSIGGAGALTINKNANHFISMLAILVQRFPGLLGEVPSIFGA